MQEGHEHGTNAIKYGGRKVQPRAPVECVSNAIVTRALAEISYSPTSSFYCFFGDLSLPCLAEKVVNSFLVYAISISSKHTFPIGKQYC